MKIQRQTPQPELAKLCLLAEKRDLRVELHAQNKALTVLALRGPDVGWTARIYGNSVRGAARRLLRDLA